MKVRKAIRIATVAAGAGILAARIIRKRNARKSNSSEKTTPVKVKEEKLNNMFS